MNKKIVLDRIGSRRGEIKTVLDRIVSKGGNILTVLNRIVSKGGKILTVLDRIVSEGAKIPIRSNPVLPIPGLMINHHWIHFIFETTFCATISHSKLHYSATLSVLDRYFLDVAATLLLQTSKWLNIHWDHILSTSIWRNVLSFGTMIF
jgi:hypothetical protein